MTVIVKCMLIAINTLIGASTMDEFVTEYITGQGPASSAGHGVIAPSFMDDMISSYSSSSSSTPFCTVGSAFTSLTVPCSAVVHPVEVIGFEDPSSLTEFLQQALNHVDDCSRLLFPSITSSSVDHGSSSSESNNNGTSSSARSLTVVCDDSRNDLFFDNVERILFCPPYHGAQQLIELFKHIISSSGGSKTSPSELPLLSPGISPEGSVSSLASSRRESPVCIDQTNTLNEDIPLATASHDLTMEDKIYVTDPTAVSSSSVVTDSQNDDDDDEDKSIGCLPILIPLPAADILFNNDPKGLLSVLQETLMLSFFRSAGAVSATADGTYLVQLLIHGAIALNRDIARVKIMLAVEELFNGFYVADGINIFNIPPETMPMSTFVATGCIAERHGDKVFIAGTDEAKERCRLFMQLQSINKMLQKQSKNKKVMLDESQIPILKGFWTALLKEELGAHLSSLRIAHIEQQTGTMILETCNSEGIEKVLIFGVSAHREHAKEQLRPAGKSSLRVPWKVAILARPVFV